MHIEGSSLCRLILKHERRGASSGYRGSKRQVARHLNEDFLERRWRIYASRWPRKPGQNFPLSLLSRVVIWKKSTRRRRDLFNSLISRLSFRLTRGTRSPDASTKTSPASFCGKMVERDEIGGAIRLELSREIYIYIFIYNSRVSMNFLAHGTKYQNLLSMFLSISSKRVIVFN